MSANLRKTIEGTTREFVMSWDAASELNDASAVNRSVTADCTRRIGPASLLSALGAPADHEQDNAYAEQNCAEDIRIAAIKTTAFENLVIDVEGRRSASRTVAEMNCFDGSGTIVLEFVWFLDFTEDGTKVKRVFEVTDPTAALQIFAKRMESGPTVGGAPQ